MYILMSDEGRRRNSSLHNLKLNAVLEPTAHDKTLNTICDNMLTCNKNAKRGVKSVLSIASMAGMVACARSQGTFVCFVPSSTSF